MIAGRRHHKHHARMAATALLAFAPVALSLSPLRPISNAATIPPAASNGMKISIVGNHFVDANGATLQLRGVNRSGTQYACSEGWGIFDGPNDAISVAAMAAWHINAVRVNGNEDCALGINGVKAQYAGDNYISALKTYVNLLHSYGMYAIVDLHHSAPGTKKASGQVPMPDADHSATYWATMAYAFKDDTAVMFDMFNEPYPNSNRDTTAAWTCVRDGGTCAGVSFTTVGMQQLVNVVRGTGATNPIMVSGPEYAGDLDRWIEFKPTDILNQLAASVHIYGKPIDSPYSNPATWDQFVAPVALQFPVVEGEGLDSNCTHKLSDQFLPWADAHGVSYTLWAWFVGNCSSEPSLISNYNGTATNYGVGLKTHLSGMAVK